MEKEQGEGPAGTDSRQDAPVISGAICCLLQVEKFSLSEVETHGFMMYPKGVEAQAEPD